MNTSLKASLLSAILAMASFVFVACEKSTGEIGLDQVIDDKAVLGTKKSLPVIGYSFPFDSIRSTGPSQEILGAYIDPVFGGVEAKFTTHMLLSLLNPDFGDNAVCDSVVLLLGYNGYYGDTNAPQTFVVNALDEYLDPDSSYYSNKQFALGKELGRATAAPRPFTRIADDGDTIAPALRIDLDKDFFQENLIRASRLSQGYFVNNVEFIKHIYGVQLSTEGYGGALLYLNISSLSSLVKVYYREAPEDTVSLRYDLYFGVFSSGNYYSVNGFAHDFSLASFDLENQDTASGEATLYVQSMAGAVTRILFPTLKAYQDSGFIINRAELILPVREGSVGPYGAPTSLLLLEDKGDSRPFVDDYKPGSNPVGGFLEIGRLRDKNYEFNITRLVHRYLNTSDTINPLILIPASSASQGWRTVLNGYQDPVKPLQFNIYYTKTK